MDAAPGRQSPQQLALPGETFAAVNGPGLLLGAFLGFGTATFLSISLLVAGLGTLSEEENATVLSDVQQPKVAALLLVLWLRLPSRAFLILIIIVLFIN